MQTAALTTLSNDVASIAKQASQSTVAFRQRGRWFSGFYWRTDVIATAAELVRVKSSENIAVLTPSQENVEGTLIGQDLSTDLALIRVKSTAHAVSARSSPGPSLGDAVVAAGRSPDGPTCAVGFVGLAGGAWRSMRGGDISARIWLDIRMMPHAEGSAVFDAQGSFIGMAVYGPRRRVLVIPSDTIARVAQELLTHGRIRRGYLGAAVQAVAIQPDSETGSTAKKTGLMIVSLDSAGPALQAGLRQGDIILALDGKATDSARTLAGMLRTADPGTSAKLAISRSGRAIDLSVMLGERPTA